MWTECLPFKNLDRIAWDYIHPNEVMEIITDPGVGCSSEAAATKNLTNIRVPKKEELFLWSYEPS